MADERFRQADAGKLAAFLKELDPGCRALTTQEIGKQYPRTRLFVAGWRVTLARDNFSQQFNVLIDTRFPFSQPKIALPDSKAFLKIPHVESDGTLCLMTGSEGVALNDIAGITAYLLDKAVELIQKGSRGELHEEFVGELGSYWSQAATSDARFWSLAQIKPPSREITFWEGKHFTLLANNKEDCTQWLTNYFNDHEAKLTLQRTVFLWLSQPLYPEFFPESSLDVLKLAEREGEEAAALIRSLAHRGHSRTAILVGTHTPNGGALLGLWLKRPTGWKNGRPKVNGFRPGKIPADKVEAAFFSASVKVERVQAARVDKTWLHTRTLGHAANRLSSKKVALIGCGALGGQLALILAQAGVGSLILCDYDTFDWKNVGRHVLSGKQAGQGKASALKAFLHERFPELNVEAVGKHWEDAYSESPAAWEGCDVIVSTTGDWPSEAALNRLARSMTDSPPVVFGWTEPYASASHALAVMESGGCLACGMDAYGRFQFAACSWEEHSSMEQREPACGTFYQPYGIVELAPAHSAIAGTVIDILEDRLKKSEHRVWLGNAENLLLLGGKWSEAAHTRYGVESGSERLIRNPWHINRDCPLCT